MDKGMIGEIIVDVLLILSGFYFIYAAYYLKKDFPMKAGAMASDAKVPSKDQLKKFVLKMFPLTLIMGIFGVCVGIANVLNQITGCLKEIPYFFVLAYLILIVTYGYCSTHARNKYLLALALVFILNGIPVFAAENSTSQDCMVKIELQAIDRDGNTYGLQSATGCFITKQDSTETTMILSGSYVGQYTEQQWVDYLTEHEMDPEIYGYDTIKFQTQAYIVNDITSPLSLVTSSDDLGFSIWRLGQALYDKKGIIFYDYDVSEMDNKNVFVYGFNETGLSALNASITGKIEEFGHQYYGLSIIASREYLGGPVCNEEGHLIGICQNNNFKAMIDIREVISAIDTMGIGIIRQSEIDAQLAYEESLIVDFSQLQTEYESDLQLDLSPYTKDSIMEFENALTNANAVLSGEGATQEEVDAACLGLVEAKTKFVEKTPLLTIILIIACAVLFVTVIILILLMATAKSRKEKKDKKMLAFTVTEAAPVFDDNSKKNISYKDLLNKENSFSSSETKNIRDQENSTGAMVNSKVAEQSVSHGMTTIFTGDTSANLSQGNIPKLVRRKTKEEIPITKQTFVIGKDPCQTDYAVLDNSAVSRVHAVIIKKGNSYFIVDRNATNGTYVNKMKLIPNQERKLSENDLIVLANEEFQYVK